MPHAGAGRQRDGQEMETWVFMPQLCTVRLSPQHVWLWCESRMQALVGNRGIPERGLCEPSRTRGFSVSPFSNPFLLASHSPLLLPQNRPRPLGSLRRAAAG